MEKNAALHHYGMAMSHKHESVVSATMQGRLDVNIAKAILFWGLMLVTMMTTLLMIYKGAPIYIFSDTNIDRITVSPWWLLIGSEAAIIVGFLVRGQWGNISKNRNRFARTINYKLYLGNRFYKIEDDPSEIHPLVTISKKEEKIRSQLQKILDSTEKESPWILEREN